VPSASPNPYNSSDGYYITGIGDLILTTVMADSFKAARTDFTRIALMLSAVNYNDGGSATVYLVPDAENSPAGGPAVNHNGAAFAGFSGAITLGTISDALLASAPSLYYITAVRSIIKQIQLVIVRGGFGTVGGLGNH
jgi:hypothetical protein